MRTVNIGDLKNQLSAYLQYVRSGEEIIVRDRNTPVARILPFDLAHASKEEALLVASGAMKMPEREIDWKAFRAIKKGNVSSQSAAKAAIESRGDR
jgi:prevent-host-death family protein